MKRRILGQSLWFWLIAAGVFLLIQGFFSLSRFDIPVISTIGGAYAQRIFWPPA